MHITYVITWGGKCEGSVASTRVLIIKMQCLCAEGSTPWVIHKGPWYTLRMAAKMKTRKQNFALLWFSKY